MLECKQKHFMGDSEVISFTEEQIYDIRSAGIIPVVSPENPGELKTLMAALSSTAVRCIEITLRCEFAPEAIKRIKQEYPHITVGAGTVKNMECARLAIDSGADFLVSPGTFDCALTGKEKINIPFLHGCMTPGEVMRLENAGHRMVKLFPAECSGGVKLLKLYEGAFSDMNFVPTGGITVDNLADYLGCKNVVACGGSFMAPKDLLVKGDSEGINKLIKSLCRQGKTL